MSSVAQPVAPRVPRATVPSAPRVPGAQASSSPPARPDDVPAEQDPGTVAYVHKFVSDPEC